MLSGIAEGKGVAKSDESCRQFIEAEGGESVVDSPPQTLFGKASNSFFVTGLFALASRLLGLLGPGQQYNTRLWSIIV